MNQAALKLVQSARNESKKPAILYSRVSGKKQANVADGGTADPFTNDKFSLDTQLEACTELAKQLGYPVSGEASFKEVYSGFELFDRPKLTMVRELIRSGQYGALICHAIDRLVRKSSHLEILMEDCKRHNVELIFVLDSVEDTAIGRFTMQARAFAAELEREKIRERTMRGKLAKTKAGKFVIGSLIYGYRVTESRSRVICEEEAQVIREIFNLYTTKKLGVEKIAMILNERGIKSPSHSSNPDSQSVWTQASVHRILTRRDYIGDAKAFYTTTTFEQRGDRRVKVLAKRDESEHIALSCEPIVSVETFEEAQRLLKTNRGAAFRNESKPVLLRSLIACSKCGYNMYVSAERYTYGPQKDTYFSVYRCMSSRRKVHSETKCSGGRIKADKADNYVWQQVAAYMQSPKLIIDALKRELEAPVSDTLTTELETVEMLIKKSEQARERFLRLLATTDDESLVETIERDIKIESRKRSELVAQRDLLLARMKAAENKRDTVSSLLKYCQKVSQFINEATTFEQKRALFEVLGVKARYANQKFEITWRFDPQEGKLINEDRILAQSEIKAQKPTKIINFSQHNQAGQLSRPSRRRGRRTDSRAANAR
jgi:Site-specific recombinases, DNA invertase Pin homologs